MLQKVVLKRQDSMYNKGYKQNIFASLLALNSLLKQFFTSICLFFF